MSQPPIPASAPILVYGLKRPHRVGSICGNPCEQCGGDSTVMTFPGMPAKYVDATAPLFIVREATHEEYVASCEALSGSVRGALAKPGERYFYVVQTD